MRRRRVRRRPPSTPFNVTRAHLFLNKDAPSPRAVEAKGALPANIGRASITNIVGYDLQQAQRGILHESLCFSSRRVPAYFVSTPGSPPTRKAAENVSDSNGLIGAAGWD